MLTYLYFLGNRPPSRNSQGSSVAAGTDNLSLQPQAPSLNPSLSHDELESLAGEGVKLSLLTKAKGIEEQVFKNIPFGNPFPTNRAIIKGTKMKFQDDQPADRLN